MQSEHEHRTPPDAVVPPSAPPPKREKEHVGRYSEGEVTCSPAALTGQAAGIWWVCPSSFQVAATSSGVL
jgi:hypothetical protein